MDKISSPFTALCTVGFFARLSYALARSPVLPLHASGPIVAGILIVRFDYLYSFWIMSAILVMAVPVFVMNVKLKANN